MLSENLNRFRLVVRKKKCRCIVTVSEVRPTVMNELIEHELDPELEVDLMSAVAVRRAKLGCTHEDQP